MIRIIITLVCLFTFSVNAQLGQPVEKCIERYGKPLLIPVTSGRGAAKRTFYKIGFHSKWIVCKDIKNNTAAVIFFYKGKV